MGYAAVLVFVSSPLAYALYPISQWTSFEARIKKGLLTDLVTGDVAKDVGWNLNTPLSFSVKVLP